MRRLLAAALIGALASCAAGTANLDKYYKNRFCVRRTVVAEKKGDEPLRSYDSYGTAYINETGADKTYYITAGHAVVHPHAEPPEGYTVTQIYYTIVKNEFDRNFYDDIPLQLLGVGEQDLAVLVADGRQMMPQPKPCQPSIGTRVFSVGFPQALTAMLDEGVVSSSLLMAGDQERYATSIDGSPGKSGSHVYAVTNTGVCSAGVMTSMTEDGHYTFVVPERYADALTKTAANRPSRLEKKLEEEYPWLVDKLVVPVIEPENNPLDGLGAEHQ